MSANVSLSYLTIFVIRFWLQSSPVVTRRGAQKAKIQTRGMVKQEEARKPSAALLEAKKKAREKLNTSAKRPSSEGVSIRDIYQSVCGIVIDFVYICFHNRIVYRRWWIRYKWFVVRLASFTTIEWQTIDVCGIRNSLNVPKDLRELSIGLWEECGNRMSVSVL